MEYRSLGHSGVVVSEVALGGWLTHGRSLDDSTTESIVKHAFDAGINFFDTADIYNKGKAEEALAIAIKDLRREDLFIGTKCFWPMTDAPNDQGLSRKHIFESVHGSLKRLQIDYIDLMQCHRPDPRTPIRETVRAMDDLIRQGKILYWGVSVWPAEAIAEACLLADEMNCCRPISNQPRYNMLDDHIEASVIPTSEKFGLSQVVFSPLAQGVLTGKYKPGKEAPAGSRGADDRSNMFMQDELGQATLEKVVKLSEIGEGLGLKMSQLALAWCLRKSNLASVIVGATSIAQLDENIGSAGVKLSDDVLSEIDVILER